MALVGMSIVEQRYQAVRAVLAGDPVTEVAEKVGVSRQSPHAWLRRYADEGLPGCRTGPGARTGARIRRRRRWRRWCVRCAGTTRSGVPGGSSSSWAGMVAQVRCRRG